MTPKYHNGRISFDVLDREFPFAVDISIPLRGVQATLRRIAARS